jgi:hypothetical protein
MKLVRCNPRLPRAECNTEMNLVENLEIAKEIMFTNDVAKINPD